MATICPSPGHAPAPCPANARIVVRAREIFTNGKEGYPAVKKVIRRALAARKTEDQPIAAGTVQPFHAKLGVA